MRVCRISVTKLFGVFDHVIPLNRDERITIIHGPNGYGKTVILQLLNAMFDGRWSYRFDKRHPACPLAGCTGLPLGMGVSGSAGGTELSASAAECRVGTRAEFGSWRELPIPGVQIPLRLLIPSLQGPGDLDVSGDDIVKVLKARQGFEEEVLRHGAYNAA